MENTCVDYKDVYKQAKNRVPNGPMRCPGSEQLPLS